MVISLINQIGPTQSRDLRNSATANASPKRANSSIAVRGVWAARVTVASLTSAFGSKSNDRQLGPEAFRQQRSCSGQAGSKARRTIIDQYRPVLAVSPDWG